MDYGTLAQASRPQMMPDAPFGAGAVAGQMYGMDSVRHDNFLAQAANQAKVQAQMDAMKAEELALGQPGRLSELRTKNAMAADTEADYNAHGKADKDQKRMMEQLKQADGLLVAISQAKDDNEVASILDNSEYYGGSKVGNKDLKALPPAVVKKIAEAYNKAKPKNVEFEQKKELEGIKGQNRLTQEAMKQAGANTRAAQKEIITRELAKIKTQKPDLFSLLYDKNGGDPEKMFEDLLLTKTATVIQQGQNQVDQANAVLPPTMQAPAPTIAPALTTKPKAASPTGPKIGDMWDTKSGSKEIIGVKRDASGKITHLNVKGVGVVEYK